jgi:hypothetical protein
MARHPFADPLYPLHETGIKEWKATQSEKFSWHEYDALVKMIVPLLQKLIDSPSLFEYLPGAQKYFRDLDETLRNIVTYVNDQYPDTKGWPTFKALFAKLMDALKETYTKLLQLSTRERVK